MFDDRVAADPCPYLTGDGSRSRSRSRPLQGEVVGILVRVVVAHAQGRGPRAHCTRIEANLEARVPTRSHCTRRLHETLKSAACAPDNVTD